MSAPAKVRTADGVVWERRAETRGGLALYAVEGVCGCPVYVMATLAELAEHGIQSAELASVVAELGALPMPVGPEAPDKLVRLIAPVLALREERYESPLHHDYRVGRDLPESGGVS